MEYPHHYGRIHKLCNTKLAITYRKTISHNLLFIISYRLIYLEPIAVFINHICRIIVPLSLRLIIFNSIHASPTSGQVAGEGGRYKRLY